MVVSPQSIKGPVDAAVSRNREAASRAEALARGGIQLATAVIRVEQAAKEASGQLIDSREDGWYRLRDVDIPAGDDAVLRIEVDDAGSRFNINSLFDFAQGGVFQETEPFLREFLAKVVDELPMPPGERALYDPDELSDARTALVRIEIGWDTGLDRRVDPGDLDPASIRTG